MKQMLNVSNLKVSFGEVSAVKDLSIKISEGQIVSITGANGAGKRDSIIIKIEIIFRQFIHPIL